MKIPEIDRLIAMGVAIDRACKAPGPYRLAHGKTAGLRSLLLRLMREAKAAGLSVVPRMPRYVDTSFSEPAVTLQLSRDGNTVLVEVSATQLRIRDTGWQKYPPKTAKKALAIIRHASSV